MTTNRHGKGQGLNRPELDRVVCSLAAMVREARFTGYSPPDIGRECPFCGGTPVSGGAANSRHNREGLTMVTFLRVIQAVLLLAAGFNSMNVWMAKQVAFAQVCEMLGVVALLQFVMILQRTGHHLENEDKARKAASD